MHRFSDFDMEKWFARFLMVIFAIILILVVCFLFFYMLPGFQRLAEGKSPFLSTYEERNRSMEECLASELYSREECITLSTKERR